MPKQNLGSHLKMMMPGETGWERSGEVHHNFIEIPNHGYKQFCYQLFLGILALVVHKI
jgi:hypothetical protein